MELSLQQRAHQDQAAKEKKMADIGAKYAKFAAAAKMNQHRHPCAHPKEGHQVFFFAYDLTISDILLNPMYHHRGF